MSANYSYYGKDSRARSDIHRYDQSDCIREGAALPERYCLDCGNYVAGRLENNCSDGNGKTVGPLWAACRLFIPKNTKPQIKPTMEKQETPKTKVCRDCGRELPADAFGRHARSRDGLQPVCRECRSKAEKGNPKYGRPKKNGTVSIPAQHAEEVRKFVVEHVSTSKKADAPTATANPSVQEIPDHDMVKELRRRGYDVKCTKTIEL